VCATTGSLVNFGQEPSALGTKVSFFEVVPGEWRPKYRVPRKIQASGYTYFADFAVTPKWFVLAKPPLQSDGFAAAMGKRMPEVLSFDPSGGAELIFVGRDKQANQEVSVPIDGLVCEGFVNAHELDGGRVVVDVVAADRWDPDRPLWETEDPVAGPRTRLVRYEVDLAKATYTQKTVFDRHLGFATVNPQVVGKAHRYAFAAVGHEAIGAGPLAGVAKTDVESGEADVWVPERTAFGGQPVFVPREGREGEDDGYLLTLVLDGAARRSEVVVLDARKVSAGPVCRIPLEAPLPHGLAACWAPDYAPDEETMERKFVLLRMYSKKTATWNAVNTSMSMIGTNPFFEKQGGKMR